MVESIGWGSMANEQPPQPSNPATPNPIELTPQEVSRYRRQLILDGFGPAGQQKLAESHVAVLGAGGLGSPAILYLGAVGVRKITIIDDDHVDVSNLHRQVIHPTAQLGRSKAQSAAAEVVARNPHVEVEAVEERLTSDNALRILQDADLVLDGTDNFATRHLASAACARLGIPHVWASILGFDAQLSVFDATHGPVYEDVYRTPPPAGSVPSCAEGGVLGPLVGVAGSTMAMEAVKLLTGIGTPLIGRLGYYSGLDGTWEYVPLVGSPTVREELLARAGELTAAPISDSLPDATPTTPNSLTTDVADEAPAGDETVAGAGTPAGNKPAGTWPADALLIDVREPDEFAAYAIPGAVNVPLSELQATDDAAQRVPAELAEQVADSSHVVVYCAAGVRSLTALPLLAEAFRARGVLSDPTEPGELPHKLHNLPGGIHAWLDQQV